MENKQKIVKNTRAFTGEVTSTAMTKTIVVRVDSSKLHPKYKKAYRVSKNFHVHDEKQEAKVGDIVKFVESRPFSKTKKCRLVEIIKANK